MSINTFFPLLLLCVSFAIILLMGIVFSYLWLRLYSALMTKCPECGKRNTGELIDTEIVDSKTYVEWDEGRKGFGQLVGQHRQVRVTENTVEDHFKCKHCGNEWTMTAQEKKRTLIELQDGR
jgi:hypothetical protein